jgi:hypothetical protein
VADPHGNLQYIPFPACAETSAPLALRFASSGHVNCTIALTDPLFHLLEFYLHADAPLSCRVPAASPRGARNRRLAVAAAGDGEAGARTTTAGGGSEAGAALADPAFVPLVFALAGALQMSHLHVGHVLNVAMHHRPTRPAAAASSLSPAVVGPWKRGGGTVDAAGAYSAAAGRWSSRIVIGDDLTLVLRVRWYATDELPGGDGGEDESLATVVARWLRYAAAFAVGYAVSCAPMRWMPWRRREHVLPTSHGPRYRYGLGVTQGSSSFRSLGKSE